MYIGLAGEMCNVAILDEVVERQSRPEPVVLGIPHYGGVFHESVAGGDVLVAMQSFVFSVAIVHKLATIACLERRRFATAESTDWPVVNDLLGNRESSRHREERRGDPPCFNLSSRGGIRP